MKVRKYIKKKRKEKKRKEKETGFYKINVIVKYCLIKNN